MEVPKQYQRPVAFAVASIVSVVYLWIFGEVILFYMWAVSIGAGLAAFFVLLLLLAPLLIPLSLFKAALSKPPK